MQYFMVPIRKHSLFGTYIYYYNLVILSFNKFHPTDATYLEIAPAVIAAYEYHECCVLVYATIFELIQQTTLKNFMFLKILLEKLISTCPDCYCYLKFVQSF